MVIGHYSLVIASINGKDLVDDSLEVNASPCCDTKPLQLGGSATSEGATDHGEYWWSIPGTPAVHIKVVVSQAIGPKIIQFINHC